MKRSERILYAAWATYSLFTAVRVGHEGYSLLHAIYIALDVAIAFYLLVRVALSVTLREMKITVVKETQ